MIDRVAGDLDDPRLGAVAKGAAFGDPLDGLFDDWAREDPEIGLLAGAIRLQVEAGGNLADKLGLLTQVLERRPS